MRITKHPIVEIPSDDVLAAAYEQGGDKRVQELLEAREERIRQAETDPLNHGFELEHWKYAEEWLGKSLSVMCLGGNRSAKTTWGARTVVKAALDNPESIIVCFAQDEDASVRIQQSAVFKFLPPEFKQKQKGQVEYINYSVKNGFTGSSLIFPNGSQILFHKYSQFIANRAKFEGLELGSKDPKWHNVGLWLDEYLEDGDLVETMRFRLATRNSKMIQTWTPIDGHTPFVASYLKDAETLKTRPAELLDGEEVPLIQYLSLIHI